MNYLWIFLGGGLGSLARHAASVAMARWCGDGFPWGTFLVNVSGSFAIGFFAAMAGAGSRWFAGPSGVHFLMVGLCGGYTTFSSFSLQTVALLRAGDGVRAGANVLGSVLLCLLAVWLGHHFATWLNALRDA